MGKLENIETLETYIEELGNEIKHVKKASTYLLEIEAQHLLVEEQLESVKQTAESLETIKKQFENKTSEFEMQLRKNEERFNDINTTVVNSFTSTEQYLKEQIGIIKQETSIIGNDLRDLQSKTNLFQQQVVSMSSNVSTVNNSLVELQRQINQIDKNQVDLRVTMKQTADNQKNSFKRMERLVIVIASILLLAIIIVRFI